MPCDDATPVSYSLVTHSHSLNSTTPPWGGCYLDTQLTYMHGYSAARNATTAAGTKTAARSSATAPQTYVDSLPSLPPSLTHPLPHPPCIVAFLTPPQEAKNVLSVMLCGFY